MANSNTGWAQLYGSTKFTQLLGANWWRRQLADSCKVITVSPGLIPGTGLSRYRSPLFLATAYCVC